MTSRTHDLFAFASLLTVARYFSPQNLNPITIITSLIANIIGALLPDLDQASNRLWDLLPACNFLGRILRQLFLSHRTLSHSILGVYLLHRLLLFLLPQILNPQFLNIQLVYFSLMIGFLSHLFLDFLTEEGIPLFFPIKLKLGFPPIKSWRIKTGKWFEKYVIFPGIILYLLYLLIINLW